MCIEKCISREFVDIVVSNVPRKYEILAGYKIVMNQRSVCIGNSTVSRGLTVLSHANSISLLIYTLLYTALNKNNGVTRVNCGRMSIR